jgi:hypothetical protein
MTTRRDATTLAISALLPIEAYAVPTRRQLVGGLASAPIGAEALSTRSDRELARLIVEYHRFDEAILTAEDEADALLVAGRRSSRGRTSAAEAACARAEALHMAQGRVANSIINLPAESFAGVAYKLVLWRKEAAILFPDDFDAAHESFTFSAYRDLLRLIGLDALAHVHDQATLARMRNYWIPS